MADHHVRPHQRKNGTYVNQYTRSSPTTTHRKPAIFGIGDGWTDAIFQLEDIKTLTAYHISAQGDDMSNRNLAFVEFHISSLTGVDFSNSNLALSQWLGPKTFSRVRSTKSHRATPVLVNCNFTNTNLTGIKHTGLIFKECDFTNANFDNVDFQGIRFTEGTNVTGSNMTSEQFKNINNPTFVTYEQKNFLDASNELGTTEKQFEYLILSGVIKVYDNKTKKPVMSGFNIDDHHVPDWELKNIQKIL